MDQPCHWKAIQRSRAKGGSVSAETTPTSVNQGAELAGHSGPSLSVSITQSKCPKAAYGTEITPEPE
jgi:hypothetical protein